MATQLKHIDLTYAPPRPTVRVAFIAGPAAVAVNDAKLPDATLEELAVRRDTEALIAAAREHLSLRMYDAFLNWGEQVVWANVRCEDDDELQQRTFVASAAVKRISSIDAQTTDDLGFKAYLLALEAGDCAGTGPLRIDSFHRSDYLVEFVVAGLADDLPYFSPLCRMIDTWSDQAWAASGNTSSFTAEIGSALLEPFRAARSAPLPAIPAGYSPYMRGPLIQWQKAYAAYTDACTDLETFDRDVHTPTESRWVDLGEQVHNGATDPQIIADEKAASTALDAAQEIFDTLVTKRWDHLHALLRLPAPGPAELAVKLQAYREVYTTGQNDDGYSAINQLVADARRFGRLGAYVETDRVLLDAFDERQFVVSKHYGRSDMTPAEDDAYFASIDAADRTLRDTRATTIEGVLVKLRVAFSNMVGQDWSDHAMCDPTTAEFRDGIATADAYTRMTWSGIEDLARIAGVRMNEGAVA